MVENFIKVCYNIMKRWEILRFFDGYLAEV